MTTKVIPADPPRGHGSLPALRIAIVEDDVELRDAVLTPALEDLDFQVSVAGSAADLYRLLDGQDFDILVLDVGLPDENGFEVAAHMRSISPIGIVMLTGLGDDDSRIRGLGLGADAYLAKPVSVEVLAATLTSLGRRLAMPSTPTPTGHWRLEQDGWQLLAPEGARIALSLSERLVMKRLFASINTPVAREELIDELTDDACDFDPHRLDMLVHRLRRKIVEATPSPLPLRAVRGRGYLLAPQPGG